MYPLPPKINAQEDYVTAQLIVLRTRRAFGVNGVGKNTLAHRVVSVKFSAFAVGGMNMRNSWEWSRLTEEQQIRLAEDAYGECRVIAYFFFEEGFECVCGKKECGTRRHPRKMQHCYFVQNMYNGNVLAFGSTCVQAFFRHRNNYMERTGIRRDYGDEKYIAPAKPVKKTQPVRKPKGDYRESDDDFVVSDGYQESDGNYSSESEEESYSSEESSSQEESESEDEVATPLLPPPAPTAVVSQVQKRVREVIVIERVYLFAEEVQSDEEPVKSKKPKRVVDE